MFQSWFNNMIKVLYDGKCGLCNKEISYYKKIANNKKFKWLDIANNPKDLKEFKPVIENGVLKLSYDKNKTNIKKIIDILNINKIDFKEINTFEGDLEDVFLKVVNKK